VPSALLAASYLAGAAFGDNLAPVSDNTIVSAFTQDADMRDVVKSRAPISLVAGAICIVFLSIFGGGGAVSALPEIKASMNPTGLLMLLSFVVVVGSALSGRHIVESLIYGNISAVIFGLLSGNMALSAVLSLPAKRGQTTGLIETGISGVAGAIIFALLILAVTQVLVESGVMSAILNWALKTIAKTTRQAELSVILVTILASIPIAANAPALLLVGPSFVKPLGEKFNLAPARRANLMDCAVCTIFFILPWHIAVIVWYGAVAAAAETWNVALPSIWSAVYNPYTWALLAVLLFSVLTGWNRKFAAPEQVKQ
jgi:Na+/H+ antiporter NhaC